MKYPSCNVHFFWEWKNWFIIQEVFLIKITINYNNNYNNYIISIIIYIKGMHLYLKSNILYSEELNGPYKYGLIFQYNWKYFKDFNIIFKILTFNKIKYFKIYFFKWEKLSAKFVQHACPWHSWNTLHFHLHLSNTYSGRSSGVQDQERIRHYSWGTAGLMGRWMDEYGRCCNRDVNRVPGQLSPGGRETLLGDDI